MSNVRIMTDTGKTVEGSSVLDALKKAYVFSVTKYSKDVYRFEEECDDYFYADLTEEQVLMLIDELKALISEES